MEFWIYIGPIWLVTGATMVWLFSRFFALDPLSSVLSVEESRVEQVLFVVVIVSVMPIMLLIGPFLWLQGALERRGRGKNEEELSEPEPLPSEFLNERIGTWNGANFIAPDGSLVQSRSYQFVKAMLSLRELGAYDGKITTDDLGDPYEPDLWSDLDRLRLGDQVWNYQRGTWAGRALMREGEIIAYTDDTHFNYA